MEHQHLRTLAPMNVHCAILLTAVLTVMTFGVSTTAIAQANDQVDESYQVSPELAKRTVQVKCSNCHAVKPTVKRFAPPLVGLIGRKAGTYKRFPYTTGLKELGIVWTKEALEGWLSKQSNEEQKHIGIKQPALRRAVVDYIATLTDESTNN